MRGRTVSKSSRPARATPPPALKVSLMAGCACIVVSGAIAQVGSPTAPLRMRTDYFGYAVSISPRVVYTDNVQLAPKGLEEDALIFSNLLTGAAVYSSQRFTGVISGDLDLSVFADDGEFAVNQRIAAASTTTLADNLLYLDIAGSTSRQLLGENARFSGNPNAARGQRANVHTYSVSPYFYREFPDRSSAELRYRWSQVFIDDSQSGANPFVGGLLNDSRSHEATAAWHSGHMFDRVQVALTAYGSRTTEDGSVFIPRFEYEQAALSAAVQIELTNSFALTGAVGYDHVDTDTIPPNLFDDDALSGVFWRAGFAARPGRRTQVRIEYGRRYDDDFIDADIAYEISSRFTFRAGASRSFETRAQTIGSQFRSQGRQTIEFVERLREGAEVAPNSVIEAANRFAGGGLFAQTIGVGATNAAYARLVGAYDRTEVSVGATFQDTDFGFREDKVYSANFDLRHQLSRRLTAYGGVFYRHSDTTIDQNTCQTSPFLFGFDVNDPLFDPVAGCLAFAAANGRTNTLGGRVGGAYRLQQNLSVFAEYAHTARWAPQPLLEYNENVVVAGVTLDF
jgi:hypothetical protein